MGIINKLDEALANKIAAGEVVERPASIVKELVENALDARSTSIQIDIEEGGLQKVKVTDNGHGFAPDDCLKAFERHATSKIHNEADLFHIHSLGFRGEALPSIASVSHFELTTGTGEGPGRHVIIEGGQLIQNKAASSRKGSVMTITKLFFNTPARLKHLKTIHTELAQISDVVNKLALAFPHVAFLFTNNGKKVFQTSGKDSVKEVLAAIYSYQTAQASIIFGKKSIDFNVNGLLVKPEITRKGRQYVYIFINHRYIRNYPIFNAVIEGYHSLLPIGRYPIAVVNIELDPTLIDVNVHPAKLEARISKEKELCKLIEEAIREALHEITLIPSMNKEVSKKSEASEQQILTFNQQLSPRKETVWPPSESVKKNPSPVNETIRETRNADAAQEHVRKTFDSFQVSHEENPATNYDTPSTHEPVKDHAENQAKTDPKMPALYPIGQMHGTYILAQNETGLYLIDQHAAQERIKYEFYREKVGETANEVQELLVPLTFELSASEYTVIATFENYLADFGLQFEPFGHNTYIIRAYPLWFPEGLEKESIEEIVQALLEQKPASVKELREELAIMMSCKKSIKANRYLKTEEIDALLYQLSECADPFTCPHGRPVIIHFTTYEMEKMFKRIM